MIIFIHWFKFWVFFSFFRSFDVNLARLRSVNIDYLPLMIVGPTFYKVLQSWSSIDIVFYFFSQLFQNFSKFFGKLYFLIFTEFFRNVVFLSNYSSRLHLAVLGFDNSIFDYLNDWNDIKSLSKKSIFLYFFQNDLDYDRFLNEYSLICEYFLVYQGSHGAIVHFRQIYCCQVLCM